MYQPDQTNKTKTPEEYVAFTYKTVTHAYESMMVAGWLAGNDGVSGVQCTYPMFKCDECLHDLLFVINDADLLNTILCPAGVYFVSPFFSILLSFCTEFRLFQFDFIEKICVLYCQ